MGNNRKGGKKQDLGEYTVYIAERSFKREKNLPTTVL